MDGGERHEGEDGVPEGAPEENARAEDIPEESVPRDAAGAPEAGREADAAELAARIGIKDNRIRELCEELAALRLEADEARAARAAGAEHMEVLDRDRGRLRERIKELEEEARGRRRRREGSERQISRLEREIERKDGEIARRDHLLERSAEEVREAHQSAEEAASRHDDALRMALGRVEGLERDLEGREAEISGLQDTISAVQNELEEERALHSRLADPSNRLRAGIDLFNEAEGRDAVSALSRTLGRPDVHVALDDGERPPVLLSFTWQGVTWQTYAADPNPAVQEPRVYLQGSGEDLSGVDQEPPNARIGPGGRVVLGL